MKIIITEEQAEILLVEGRIDTLRTMFGVFDEKEIKKDKPTDNKSFIISNLGIIAILEKNRNGKVKITLSEIAFNKILESDPSPKKIFTQWMLNLLVNMIKEGETTIAARFIDEDINGAQAYLEKFIKATQSIKRFKERTAGIEGLPTDIGNINQYKTIDQLSKAVEPFMEKGDSSQLETTIRNYVSKGEARIWLDTSNYLVWSPYSIAASRLELDSNTCLLSKHRGGLTTWCTAFPPGMNNYFEHYTKGSQYKKPDGSDSELFVVIGKGVLNSTEEMRDGANSNIFQIHFESEQYMDYKDIGIGQYLKSILESDPTLNNFIKEKVTELFKMGGGDMGRNKYYNTILKFGDVTDIFHSLDKSVTELVFKKSLGTIPPEIGEFTQLDELIITNGGITSIPPEIGNLQNLTALGLHGNSIKTLPKEIGKLKNLEILQLKGNPLINVPDELSNLSPSNGGSLSYFTVDTNISNELYDRIQGLLPDIEIFREASK